MSIEVRRIAELDIEQRAELESNQLVKRARSIWKYSQGSVRYYEAYFLDASDHSIVLLQSGLPVAFVLLYESPHLSYFGMPIEVFLDDKLISKKAITKLIGHLKELAAGKTIRIYFDDLLAYQMLKDPELDFEVTTALTYAVDLRVSMDEIRKGIRRRYKSMINWGLKNIEYRVVDSQNLDDNEFYALKEFHFQTSGRKTRSDHSWEVQLEMIKSGEAFLINGYLNDSLVSSAWYMLGQTTYYGVGVYDRTLMAQNKSIAHGSMFSAIAYLKDAGHDRLLLAEWETESDLTEKEEQILDFKRGFTNIISSRNIMKVEVKGVNPD